MEPVLLPNIRLSPFRNAHADVFVQSSALFLLQNVLSIEINIEKDSFPGSPVYCEKQDPWLFCKSGYKIPLQV